MFTIQRTVKKDISNNREAAVNPRHLIFKPEDIILAREGDTNIRTHTNLGLCDELPVSASAPVNYGGVSTMMR